MAGRGKCSSFARHSRRTCRGWDGRPAIRSTGCPFFDGLIATYYYYYQIERRKIKRTILFLLKESGGDS